MEAAPVGQHRPHQPHRPARSGAAPRVDAPHSRWLSPTHCADHKGTPDSDSLRQRGRTRRAKFGVVLSLRGMKSDSLCLKTTVLRDDVLCRPGFSAVARILVIETEFIQQRGSTSSEVNVYSRCCPSWYVTTATISVVTGPSSPQSSNSVYDSSPCCS
jgi:hypothetical protein